MPADELRRVVSHPLTADMVRPLAAETIVVQVHGTLTSAEFAEINGLLRDRPTVTLRVFSGYGETSPADLGFLEHVPDLRALQVGWPDLKDLGGLAAVSQSLVSLRLEATSGKCSLEPVRDMTVLEEFGCAGSYTDLAAIAELPSLRELSLSKAVVSMVLTESFRGAIEALSLFGPSKLKRLDLPDAMSGLRYLQLERSTSLSEIDVVAGLGRLECLVLDNLSALTRLPDLSDLHQLRRLEIIACKRLGDVSPIGSAPGLQELVLSQMPLTASDVVSAVAASTLGAATVALSGKKEAQAAAELLQLPSVSASSSWQVPRVRRLGGPA